MAGVIRGRAADSQKQESTHGAGFLGVWQKAIWWAGGFALAQYVREYWVPPVESYLSVGVV